MLISFSYQWHEVIGSWLFKPMKACYARTIIAFIKVDLHVGLGKFDSTMGISNLERWQNKWIFIISPGNLYSFGH